VLPSTEQERRASAAASVSIEVFVSRDDVGLGGSHLAEEMRAIVPGYQSAVATTARRGARSTRQLSVCKTAAADAVIIIIIITIIQYNHTSIYTRQNATAASWSNFFTRLPFLPRFSGNWNRRFRAFSAIFLNLLTGAHAAGQLRPMAVARSASARPGKPASHPATRTHRSYRHRLYRRDATVAVSRATRGREIFHCGISTHKHASAHAHRHTKTIALYDTTSCIVSAVLIE